MTDDAIVSQVVKMFAEFLDMALLLDNVNEIVIGYEFLAGLSLHLKYLIL